MIPYSSGRPITLAGFKVHNLIVSANPLPVNSMKCARSQSNRWAAPASMLVPTWLLIGANLYVGINASLITTIARQGANALIGQTTP